MPLNRYKAFAVHLLVSVAVALLTAGIVFGLWYPGKIADAAGVAEIFLIVLGVDVVIGPLVTLIVFNVAKKELKRDLLIVLVLQLAALAYGMHTVWIARPVYQVFNAGRFDLIYANDLDSTRLSKAVAEEFKTLPWLGPRVVGAKAPTDRKLRQEMLLSSISGGDDLPQMLQYYTSYEAIRPEVVERQQPLNKLLATNARNRSKVEALMTRYASRDVGFVPLRGKVKDLTVVVDAKTGDILEMVPLDPW